MLWNSQSFDLWGFVEVWNLSPTTYLRVDCVRGCHKAFCGRLVVIVSSSSLRALNSEVTSSGTLTCFEKLNKIRITL